MTNRQVLMLIAAFLVLTLGSFIWYIATWDSRQADAQMPYFILAEKLTVAIDAPLVRAGMAMAPIHAKGMTL